MNALSTYFNQAVQYVQSKSVFSFGGGATDSTVADSTFEQVVAEQGFAENLRTGGNNRKTSKSTDTSSGWRTHLVNAVQNLSSIGLVPPQIAIA